ncbi:LysR family transcriptional regulator [Psychromicrobium xiongbiense]|uniref:LysR family transcriptional regulator n=1 Tax=Psychromicrobium xiongbiense TaxID=3051184 RepID=UPI002552A840|nr:LysR family transcriptional regulator [Psychromicrobium sp. YIM S02556]
MPDLRALELLDAIARTASITLAAGELGVTQQAASLRLRRLEQRLGRQLVIRASRSSELTEYGTALLTIARPVLGAALAMDGELAGLLLAERPLTVAASLTVAEYFLPQWILTFARNGNDPRSVRSRATNTREVVRMVSESEADLGFVEGNEPPQGLRYQDLAQDELAVYVAPTHRWAALGHISSWTLAGTPLVTREQGSGCRAVLHAALLQHGVERSEFAAPLLELPSNIAVLQAAVATVAPAVISTRPAEPYVQDGRLVRVRVDHVTFHRQLGAVWKRGELPASHAARELLHAAMHAVRADQRG